MNTSEIPVVLLVRGNSSLYGNVQEELKRRALFVTAFSQDAVFTNLRNYGDKIKLIVIDSLVPFTMGLEPKSSISIVTRIRAQHSAIPVIAVSSAVIDMPDFTRVGCVPCFVDRGFQPLGEIIKEGLDPDSRIARMKKFPSSRRFWLYRSGLTD